MTESLQPLVPTPDLAAVARRCVWFMEPEAALARPAQFIAYLPDPPDLPDPPESLTRP